MRHTEAADALRNLLQLGDPDFCALQGPIQLMPHVWANRLAGLPNVDGAGFLDLLQRQSEGAQATDHVQAPQGGLVEKPVIAATSAEPVDQLHAIEFT